LRFLKDYKFEYPQSNRTVIRREPIGVVGAITPWNWPINQFVIKAWGDEGGVRRRRETFPLGTP
jgi:acyl-CoA reductase-like NAD-dependent aldehyde dehydrogenase